MKVEDMQKLEELRSNFREKATVAFNIFADEDVKLVDRMCNDGLYHGYVDCVELLNKVIDEVYVCQYEGTTGCPICLKYCNSMMKVGVDYDSI